MFKVYKASAGSGKTTSLVAEYLSLCLLKPEKFRHILAVTFTNNATAEMKDRIVKTLQAFAFVSPNDFDKSDKVIYDALKKIPEFQHIGEQEFQQRSMKLLKEILYDYPDFTISTIDSFFQRIIRSFAFDLGINLNYNVQTDLTDCYNQTVDMLLNKLSKSDKGLFGRFMFMVDKKMNEKGRWQLEGELKRMLSTIYNEDAYEASKALNALYQQKIQRDGHESNMLETLVMSLNQKKSVGEEALKDAIKALQKLVNALGDDPSLFVGGKTGFYGWMKTLSQGIETQDSASLLKAPGANVYKAIEADSLLKKPSQEVLQMQPKIVEAFHKVEEAQQAISDISAIMQCSSSILLLFDLKDIMEDIKLRDNLFFLSESNGRIYDEIKDVDVPYIYEKIGSKYSYFFIDEFQDTSKMQWEDFKPLIKNAIAGINQFNEAGSTILFGDVKQSIYRFRNGDSSLLNQLSSKEGVRENLSADIIGDDDFQLESLDVNYRSSKAVVDFNNRFFKYLCEHHFGENELLNRYYADVAQKNPSDKEGFVYIRFMTEEDGTDYLLEESLKAVNNALERGYSYGDMAILAKANNTCSEIANYLSSNNIPVISSDSLLLGSSEEVVLIVNTLKYLLNPNDKLVQLAIAGYFGKEQLSDAIHYICQEDGFAQYIRSLGDKVNADRLLDVGTLLSFPVFTIIKELLSVYHLSEADAYVVAFIDAVYENFNAQFSDVTQCVKWWEEKGRTLSISSSKETDAVTVMSVHKSKGLQFPVVIYPMKSYKMSNGKDTEWVRDEEKKYGLPYFLVKTSKKALERTSFAYISEEESVMTDIDNVNLIYVAHTRAADVLYIITGKPDKRGNYAKFLKGFVEDYKSCFSMDSVTDESLQYEYWFGDKNYNNQKTKKSCETSPQPVGQLYCSNFTLRSEQLVCGRRMSEKQELGVFVHDFLSTLQHFPQNEDEMSECLLTVESADDRKLLETVLREIMNDDSLKPYFAPGVKVLNETSILCPNGQLRRPDRVVFMDDEVMVIDYKTGQESEQYQEQLSEYCTLLEQMGYENVHGRLIYL